MSKPEHMHVPEEPQRFDVFTGAGRRRRFSSAEKAAIVEESYGAGISVCGVAGRHGLTFQQMFGWHRLTRLGSSSSTVRPLLELDPKGSQSRPGCVVPVGDRNG